MTRNPAVLLAAVVLLASCNGQPDKPEAPCLYMIMPAIEVTVVDAVTGNSITASASGFVREGEFVDSLSPCTFDGDGHVVALCGASGHSGTVEVGVTAPDHQPWDTAGVVIPVRRCGNSTAHIDVRLRPSRPPLTGRWIGTRTVPWEPHEELLVFEFEETDSSLTGTGRFGGWPDPRPLVCYSWMDTLKVFLPNDLLEGTYLTGVQAGHVLTGQWDSFSGEDSGAWHATLQ